MIMVQYKETKTYYPQALPNTSFWMTDIFTEMFVQQSSNKNGKVFLNSLHGQA